MNLVAACKFGVQIRFQTRGIDPEFLDEVRNEAVGLGA